MCDGYVKIVPADSRRTDFIGVMFFDHMHKYDCCFCHKKYVDLILFCYE